MRQNANLNNIISSYLDGDRNRKDTNDISFNKNSIAYTLIQNPNNY